MDLNVNDSTAYMLISFMLSGICRTWGNSRQTGHRLPAWHVHS